MRSRGVPIRFAAALAALAAAIPTPTQPVTGTPAVAQQDGTSTKQIPASPAAQVGDLAFLTDYGVPRYHRVGGCPWPGRREACARRSSGTTRRMR